MIARNIAIFLTALVLGTIAVYYSTGSAVRVVLLYGGMLLAIPYATKHLRGSK